MWTGGWKYPAASPHRDHLESNPTLIDTFRSDSPLVFTAMFEYASVTASAYDVDSLVGKLNAHASQGWEVTSVVAAGGDVVAIMHRVRSEADAAAVVATPAVEAVEEAAPVVEEAPAVVEEASAFSEASSYVADVAPAAETATLIDSVAPSVSETVSAAADVVPDSGSGFGGIAAGVAGAATGVGVGSIFGHDTPAVEVPEVPAVEVVAPVAEVSPVIETIAPVVPEVPAAVEPTGWGSAQTTVGTPVAPVPVAPVPAPAPVVTTPAGWYPDPSGRFEMRYWDGSAWTEHVSRQGQQFTDPPVA